MGFLASSLPDGRGSCYTFCNDERTDHPMKLLKPPQSICMCYRGLACGLALLLSLPSPDLIAQPSAKSIFATRQANHTAVQQRNLRELEAKQGMTGKAKTSTVHRPQSTVHRKTAELGESRGSLRDQHSTRRWAGARSLDARDGCKLQVAPFKMLSLKLHCQRPR